MTEVREEDQMWLTRFRQAKLIFTHRTNNMVAHMLVHHALQGDNCVRIEETPLEVLTQPKFEMGFIQ